MPGHILHLGATVTCAHEGQAQPTMPNLRVKVNKQPVVTSAAPYTIAGCKLPPPAGGPCVTAQWTVAAQRVKVGGLPVLLRDSQATCTPTGTSLIVKVTQERVKGM